MCHQTALFHMDSTATRATTRTHKMAGRLRVPLVSRLSPHKMCPTHNVTRISFALTGSTHSPFYAQNMMYMRAYDPSGFQRTSPYGMGKSFRLILIYRLNWAALIDFFVFTSCFWLNRKCNGLSIWWRPRVRELRRDQHTTMATRRHRTLLVQCMWTIPQNERHESATD